MDPEELREAFLGSLPTLPFLPDDVLFRQRQPPVDAVVRWDWAKDDFPQGFSNDFQGFVVSPPGHRYVDTGSHGHYQLALEDLELAMMAAASLPWNKEETVPRVWCHREIEGTVCAVHRWDAVVDTNNESGQANARTTIGRLQCWNDPGLRVLDPTFIEVDHPEFDDAGGEGSTCVLELAATHTNGNDRHHHFVAMGFPAGCVKIATNQVRIEENWDVGWEVEITQDSDTVTTVLQKMKDILVILIDSKREEVDL